MIDFKKINLILIVLIALLLSFVVVYNVHKYMKIEAPTFERLVSARIMGTNERDVFLEMVWSVQNPSRRNFSISETEMFFYEFGEPIARIYFEEKIRISPRRSTNIKVYATIEKHKFESLMYNFIDVYSFNMSGTTKASTLFMRKELKMFQFIPINIKEMVTNYLILSFRNAIAVDRVNFYNEGSNSGVEFNLRMLNRTGFDLRIEDFTGDLEINRTISGFNPVIEQVAYLDGVTRGITKLRFSLDQRFVADEQPFRYVISGLMKMVLWDTEYIVSVEISGDSM